MSADQNPVSMQGGEEAVGSGASQGAHNSGSKIHDGGVGSQNDEEVWVTTEGHYQNGKIIA